MTAREKLAIEHPNCIVDEYFGGCNGCPHMYGYLPVPDYCGDSNMTRGMRCIKCWDRDIPEYESKEGERKQMYSLFLKEFTNGRLMYKLLEENKDLTTISEKVKRLVISGTPIDDLRIVKNVEFEFKCALKFKEDE